jgi:hypothetical protein
VKINWTGDGCVSDDDIARNVAYCAGLGLPELGKCKPGQMTDRPLAVVGGGRSVLKHLHTLRDWPGDIWAINGTAEWLRTQGIEAAFFSVDADPIAEALVGGVKRAIAATRLAPGVFDRLMANGADIKTFHTDPSEARNGPTTATTAPFIALDAGYKGATFFGCDSCYPPDAATHLYTNERDSVELMVVRVGIKHYLTKPEFEIQARLLAGFIRKFPAVFREESGGMLRAFVRHRNDYDITRVSPALMAKLDRRPLPADRHAGSYMGSPPTDVVRNIAETATAHGQ